MTHLDTRKQALITESELNRAHLSADIAQCRAQLQNLTARAKSIGTLSASIALLVGVFFNSGHRQTTEPPAKTSMLGKLLKGAGLVSSIWLALRSKQRTPK